MKTNLLHLCHSRLILSLVAIVMAATIQLHAQHQNARPEVSEQGRTEFAKTQAKEIAKELDLNESDAARFTTVYLNYQNEMWKIRPKNHPRKGIKADNITEQQAQEFNREWLRHQKDFCDVKEKYYNECCKFLSQRQIFKANDLERKAFERMMQHHKSAKEHGKKAKENKEGKSPVNTPRRSRTQSKN